MAVLTLRCTTFYIWLEYFFSDSFDPIKYGENSFKNPHKKDMVLGPKMRSGQMWPLIHVVQYLKKKYYNTLPNFEVHSQYIREREP